MKSKTVARSHNHPRRVLAGLLICIMLVLSACRPYIKSFTPANGAPGTVVTITGDRFTDGKGPTTVQFGPVAVPTADVLSLTKSSIQARVPAGAETGLISVTTSKGRGESKVNFRVDSQNKWTFMVYLDADNNLEAAGLTDFAEMALVGSTAGVNIVVQMDRIAGYTAAYGDWTGTRRFLIQSGDNPSMTPLQDLGEQNMGDPDVLEDFVEWAITNYRAERYALVIWDHGDGWRTIKEEQARTVEGAATRGESDWAVAKAISSDDTDNDKLYMREVQSALESAKQDLHDRHDLVVELDLVGFDACLMGMVEVAYAMRNVASYVVGSEETEPANGWPYDAILGELVATPTLNPEQLADVIVSEYVSSYGTRTGITQSAIDISQISSLKSKIDAFTYAASGEWSALADARTNTIQYHPWGIPYCWGVDLWDYADEVYSRVVSTTIKSAALDLKTAVDNAVVSEGHSSDMSGSHGIAIYFPPTEAVFNSDPDHAGYLESNTFMPVDFVGHSNWDNWLQDYYVSIP
ncbi:MAG: clostripain-related cysteine peptidase [Planctomycetota bacterium]|jgi:hypothetical protein